MRSITEALEKLELVLFPSSCKICGNPLRSGERVICRECLDNFPFHSGPMCPVCGKPYFSPSALSVTCGDCLEGRPFLIHRSAGLYEGNLRQSILLYKYGGYESLAKPLARFASTQVDDVWEVDCIVPLPSHIRRIRERGFDHILLIARRLSKLRGLPVEKLLYRTKYTPPQVELPRHKRKLNPRGSFALRKTSPCSRVLLIDDVWTTGATITEASKVLRKAGYQVHALTLARSV